MKKVLQYWLKHDRFIRICFAVILISLCSVVQLNGQTTEVAKLVSNDIQTNDKFGVSVSMNGDLCIVAADGEDTGANNAGAAYIYQRATNGEWNELAKLQANDIQASHLFGQSVSISGNTAIVGARGDDAGGIDAGAAYIFERNSNGDWLQTAKLQASNSSASENFGQTVAISGDVIAIGTFGRGAYIFERDSNGGWSEVLKIQTNDGRTNFKRVAIDGQRVVLVGGTSIYIIEQNVVGVWNEVATVLSTATMQPVIFGESLAMSSDKVIVGATGNGIGSVDEGAAYFFERDANGNWSEVAVLQSSDKELGDRFGGAVSIEGNRAVVGASGKDTDGDINAGVAYLFERDTSGNWSEIAILQTRFIRAFDLFGGALSMSAGRILIGSNFAGQSDRGAAYVYEEASIEPPSQTLDCQLLRVNPGPPLNIDVQFSTASGVATIEVLKAKNAIVEIPTGSGNYYSQGDLATLGDVPTTILVNAFKVDNSKGSSVVLRATDASPMANQVVCDPVYTTLSTIAPENFQLEQNYPNPFNPTTTIRFGVALEQANVSLKIFDVAGREVRSLINENMVAGQYAAEWDGKDSNGFEVAGGVYFYRLISGQFVQTRQMTLLK